MSKIPGQSLRTLLSGAIDYAGLFPPAGLDMATAVRNYAAYRRSEHAWALGRFIVPLSRLAEFESALHIDADDEDWPVSALIDIEPEKAVAAIFGFNKRRRAMIDTVELKASTVGEIKRAAAIIPLIVTTFVEIPLGPGTHTLIAAVGAAGFRAKVRTGGVTQTAFPASADLAAFIRACATTRVPFKATAGLHHPLRSEYRLTYDEGSPAGTMYGFVNLFVATGVAIKGGSMTDIRHALEERSATAFAFSERTVTWRTYVLDINAMSELWVNGAMSFGSCSFTEPIDDLTLLGLL
jgi:hypothetical protein